MRHHHAAMIGPTQLAMINDSNVRLIAAAGRGDVAATQAALALGADVNINTALPLYLAACYGYTDLARLLLTAGADVHPREAASMVVAAGGGHTEIVGLLLLSGADVDVNHGVALCAAVENNKIEVVRVLLTAGANVHVRDEDALRQAALNQNHDMVRLLLAAGADPVIAWVDTKRGDRRAVAAALTACADTMTAAQCSTLANQSALFVAIRAPLRSSRLRRGFQRGV